MARIALNARLLIPGKLEGIGGYTDAICARWVAACPEEEFLLRFDRAPHPDFNYGPNVEMRRLLPPARRPLLMDAWFDVSVARDLRRWGADVFVSMDGYLSRGRVPCPQISVMHDLNFEHHPEWIPAMYGRHYRARFPEYARLATHVVTVSEYSRQDIMAKYKCAADKVSVIGNAADPLYRPLDRAQREAWRTEHLAGERYWLFVGSLHPRKNIGGLLNAYRAYRAAGGEAKLVVVGAGMFGQEADREPGVVWLGRRSKEELAQWMGAAEGLVYLPHFEGFGVPIIEAMAAAIPVVASAVTSIPEVCGDAAAALVAPDDAVGAADAMRRLETEKAWRDEVIARGRARAGMFSWDVHAQSMNDLARQIMIQHGHG